MLFVVVMLLLVFSPVVSQLATAQGTRQDPVGELPDEQIAEQPEDVVEATEPVATDPVATEPVAATEMPVETVEAVGTEPVTEEVATEAAVPDTNTLTISVFRCDHPEFDPYLSSNFQIVAAQCTGPGYADFIIESSIQVPPASGSQVTVEIDDFLLMQEQLRPGYTKPIANCFLYDDNGSLVDQIGPGDASGGGWKVGGVAGDVHCDWYQVDRGIGVVYVVNMACPSTAGLFPAPTMNELVSMCTEPAGARQFFVGHGPGLSRMGVSGGEFNDVFFDAIKTGPIEIWLDDPTGFDQARVFCQVTTLEGAEIAPFSEVGVGSFRTTGLTLVHGQRLHCSWFNIQEGPGLAQPDGNEPPLATIAPTAPTGSNSTLTVKLSTCPVGYDPTVAGTNPETDCTPGPNGVNFTLIDSDPNTVDLMTMTGDSIPNAVTFGGIPGGDYTVTQDVPGDVAGSFSFGCGSGGGIGEIPHFNSGTEIVGVAPGVLRTCRWFNILTPGATVEQVAPDGSPVSVQSLAPEGSPVSIAALTGTSSLTMYAYACPAGFDVTTVDVNPQAACSPIDGFSFDLDDSVDNHAGWAFETGWTGPGYHTIDMLAADRYSISAHGQNGVTSSFAWDCYDLAGTSSRTDPLAMGEFLAYDLGDGEQVRCDWYFVTGGEGRVIINSHACGILVPSYTLTFEQLGQQCTDDPGTRNFTVVSHTHQETQPASKSPLVLASFAGVPSGYVAVVEDNVAGWGTPIVYCQVSLEDGTVVSPATHANIVVGRHITFELEPGHVVYCDWYNVTAGFVDVHITKRVCPDGFDAYTADYATLSATCTGDPGTVDFTVEDGGLYFETKPASAADAMFTDVPSGSLRISEKLPDGQGMPVVFCRVDFEDGSSVLPVAEFAVGYGPSVNVNLSGGQVLYCDWYNVVGGIGSVHVWKQACPPGLDVHAMTRQELELQCGDDIGTIEFSLTSGTFSASASSTNLFRYADFPAVPAGELTLTETLPTGYGEPIVFCRAQGGPEPVGQDEKMTVEGESSISWLLETGTDLYCRWFNVAYEETTGDNGRVVNYKRFCPDGVDLSAPTLEVLEQACTEVRGGVAFTVENANGFSRTAVTSSQTGVAIIENVPPLEITIRETIPDGYGEPIVFCDSLPKDQRSFMQIPMAQITATDGAIAYEVQPKAEVHCHWFNIVSSGNTVVVIKRDCPEGTATDQDAGWYGTTCTEPHAGVEFKLTASMGTVSRTTDAAGEATWNSVPLGPFSLQEYIPTGYGEPVVFCGVVSSTGGAPLDAVAKQVDATGGYHESTFGYTGTVYVCYWYNIPGNPGEVTIYKHTCPEGYDPNAWGADPKVDCPEGTNGVLFTASGPDGYQGQSSTGDSIEYAVFFGGLDPGDYTITEQVPEGIGLVFVWDCYGQMMGELRPTPLSVGETLTIAVGADESITCHWYNVPHDPDGKLTVIKYTCATLIYVSEVDCEVYEGGQGFDLAWWNGDSWEIAANGTTGVAGSYTWVDLDAGEYWLDERDREWCHLSSDWLSDDGNWINVYDGQESIVRIYNCTGEPGKPGKTPTKYPNTGVPMREEWRLTA
jgi:hypothetical protein